MIQRRSVIMGICGLVAAPAVVRATSIMPIRTTNRLVINPSADPSARSVLFTIHGWDGIDLGRAEQAGQHIVPIYLPNSWRSSWL
jgi:hypothetical protein